MTLPLSWSDSLKNFASVTTPIKESQTLLGKLVSKGHLRKSVLLIICCVMGTVPLQICRKRAAFWKRFAGVRCIPLRGPPTRLTGWAVGIREECGVGSGLGAAPRVFLEKGMYWGWAAPLVERGKPEVRHLEHSSGRCLKRVLFLGTSASARRRHAGVKPLPVAIPPVAEQRRGMR